ncbi:OmpW family outer membrane protein [Halomonas almeriensis]|uniref:OmpW/AlkL family protein n=1 Tax=Halomonas almeriensis TaxID=308163 RepID=UPI0025B48CB8|nr:OmpW family outer membrane protein [Halomonas almeriensis]MDN3552675.1 OmpW family outer membrane protein [Halomonas almeriensis]
MQATRLISATAIAVASLCAAQAAMAYQAGDIYVRGGYAKSDIRDDNDGFADRDINVENAQGITYGAGYLFSDHLGVELNGAEAIEHDMTGGSFERTPINLMANYFPLGGTDSRVQPYAGVGVNHTYFSNESIDDLDHSTSLTGQLGVDFAISDQLMIGSYAQYADVDSDVSLNGDGTGQIKLDPLTIGGNLTFRF